MTNDNERTKRTWIVLDLESAVTDESGHKRYQQMERWTPSDSAPSRRGYTRGEDPLTTPFWSFQTIVTASLLSLTEHPDGNLQVSRFVTLSAPEHSEREVIEGVLQVLADAPKDTELVTFAGQMHDIVLLTAACLRFGLTLPANWRWMSFNTHNGQRHLDLARALTGGLKMKPVHLSELLAACDLPGKMSAPAFAVARLIEAGQWDFVQEACEGDVISTALLFARWRKLHDDRADIADVEDRLLRQIVELRRGRGYVGELEARRRRAFARRCAAGREAAEVLAPYLTPLAA